MIPVAYIILYLQPNHHTGTGSMALVVITKAPRDGKGNLYAPIDEFFIDTGYGELDTPDIKGATWYAAEVAIALRFPLFRAGEILHMEGDRDQFGRKPSKWRGVEFETFDSWFEAVKRAREVADAIV